MSDFAEHLSDSVEATESIAAELARTLVGGECIAPNGELGAGKTQFVRGLIKGLHGNTRSVCSPTYVLLNIYDSGRLVVYHLDAYRISGSDDFDAIGFPELLEQRGVVVIEWARRIHGLLPPTLIEVSIQTTEDFHRRISVKKIAP